MSLPSPQIARLQPPQHRRTESEKGGGGEKTPGKEGNQGSLAHKCFGLLWLAVSRLQCNNQHVAQPRLGLASLRL